MRFENYDFNSICKHFTTEKIFPSKMSDNVGLSKEGFRQHKLLNDG